MILEGKHTRNLLGEYSFVCEILLLESCKTLLTQWTKKYHVNNKVPQLDMDEGCYTWSFILGVKCCVE